MGNRERHELVDAQAMRGADIHKMVEAQLGKLRTMGAALVGICLVDHQDDGLGALAQGAGEFQVNGGHALHTVHDEEDEIRFLHGEVCLRLHLGGEFILNGGSDAPRIHDVKGHHASAAGCDQAVTGDPWAIMHDGDVFASEAVEKGGLPHVGAADDGDHFRILDFHDRMLEFDGPPRPDRPCRN